MKSGKNKNTPFLKRKGVKISLITLVSVFLFLQSGIIYIHQKGSWRPDYKKEDISKIITQTSLDDEDFQLLFAQTGLNKTAVKQMLNNSEQSKILKIQNEFFADYKVRHDFFAPFTCSDKIDKNIPLAPIEDGDIIISPSSHFSYLKSGHAAIVVNAKEGRILNATGYGTKSVVEDITELNCRPAFVVLRLKADQKTRSEIALFAAKNLIQIKYSLTAGIFGRKTISSTHCGHLVWYAFNEFGFNLDSNKGLFVWPKDIVKSEYLEVIQIFGVDPKIYWY